MQLNKLLHKNFSQFNIYKIPNSKTDFFYIRIVSISTSWFQWPLRRPSADQTKK